MAKYIKQNAGGLEEVIATVTSLGNSSAGDIIALDSTGRISQSVLPVGVGPDTETIVASEDLSSGDLVNIFNDAGTIKVRKADATSISKRAHGFVIEAFLTDANALVYKDTTITGLTIAAADVGKPAFLSTVGAYTFVAPVVGVNGVVAGHISQEIGVAVSTTSLSFEAATPIKLA